MSPYLQGGKLVKEPRHTCHAIGCDTPCPPRMFMCRKHWFMLSHGERDEVWRHYVPGQESDWSKVTPEYLDATMAIVERLAERESAANKH